jgi:phenylalanyl-tRNA synthetase beta subunit
MLTLKFLGIVHPEVNKKYEIPTPISILEIILEDVIKI